MPSFVLGLALSPALAFDQPDDVWVGIEPHRVQSANPWFQAELRRSQAFQTFLATDGAGWHARFDEVTGTPRWMWGRGIPMPTSSPEQVARAVRTLLQRHPTLLGLEGAELVEGAANYSASMDTWYVTIDLLRDGLPTYRGGITARIKHGNLVLLVISTAPDAPVTGSLALTPERAIELARAEGPAPTAVHTEEQATSILLEQLTRHGLELRKTWQVQSRTYDPPGKWVTFVDGASGELLNVHNEVRFLTGEVTALHHERTVDGSPLISSPVPYAPVSNDVDADVTDGNGLYDVAVGGDLVTVLEDGDHIRVFNDDGSEGLLISNGPDLEWTDADATQAEIDSYVFLHQVREWGLRVAPDVPAVTERLDSFVNQNNTCNAYWDGSVNFFRSGGGCNNTGQIADVNFHEWGHGFHYWSIEAGYFDSSLSEGAADTVSFLITGDNLIAPNFGQSGWAIRDVDPDQVYPEDYSNSQQAVHSNGLIYGGTMWDLFQSLKAEHGDAAGTEIAEQLHAGIVKGGTDIPGTYFEALVADDDDGNVDNGTPNVCLILEAFESHGIGPTGGAGAFVPGHEPLVTEPADVPTPIAIEVLSSAPECVSVAAESATLFWRKNGKAWKEEPVGVTATDITGQIPAQKLGTFVEYYIEGIDTDGADFAAPMRGEVAPYSYFVGDVIEIDCEDFEDDDGGWTHKLVSGEDQDGADDWQWGAPTAQSGDPAAAYSGGNVWGNDLGYDNFNGAYQSDKVNRVKSPKVETAHYTDVFLQYRRWLNVEDATDDLALITANQEEVWRNFEGNDDDHHEDRQWISHSVDLQGIADMGSVRIAFEIHSDGSAEFGGWNVDDVCIYAPATADNRLGIVDFVTEDQDGPIGLSWTNPVHDPVEQVKVVRHPDRFPNGHTDGDTVVTLDDPVAGELVQTVHTNFDGVAGYYAVYAFDGEAWLSWTIEGWNASRQDSNDGVPGGDQLPNGDAGGDGSPGLTGQGGCGCDAAPVTAGWVGLALAGLVVSRRRRR